jgi:pilus assembly protein CpaC
MHHKKCSLLSLVTALALGLCAGLPGRAAAQEAGTLPRLEITVGATTAIQMTTKSFIKSARSENPTVATITIKVDDPKIALVKGEKIGYTRIFLTDKDNHTETYDVFVGQTAEQLRQEFLALVRRTVPASSVDAIFRGGTIILTGNVANAESIQVIIGIANGLFAPPGGRVNIINGMRIGGVQQVELDVVVAAVNRSEARNMSFNFINTGANHFVASNVGFPGTTPSAATGPLSLVGTLATSIISPAAALGAGTPDILFGIVNNKQGFVGFLNALRQENLVKILAEPKLVTLSGRPAYIIDGGQVPYVATSLQGANVNYLPFGTSVNFLPIVLGNGKIHLEINPQVSQPNAALALTVSGTNPVSAPAFNTRTARVTVQMEDGQTLAIGGLIQNNVSASTSKIPCLGDLPFIGVAFRTVSYQETEEELLILVTPRLVDPLACNQVPKYLPGQETRSPDDFELFLEGIMEAPRGQRTISLGGYRAAYHNAPPARGMGNGTMGHEFVHPAAPVVEGNSDTPAPRPVPEPRRLQPVAAPDSVGAPDDDDDPQGPSVIDDPN